MKRKVKVLISFALVLTTLFLTSVMSFAASEYPSAYYPKNHLDFKDVNKNDWYYDAVNYVSNGYMYGYGGEREGYFGPADHLQRQDMAVVLYRYSFFTDASALPKSYGKNTKPSSLYVGPTAYNKEILPWIMRKGQFADVANNAYYSEAVNVLRYRNIVSGYNNGRFGVGDKITREQFITMIYRYEGGFVNAEFSDKELANFYKFQDSNMVSRFAKDAMVWGINAGIISGKRSFTNGAWKTYLAPQDSLSRAEAATILMRLDWYHKYALAHAVG